MKQTDIFFIPYDDIKVGDSAEKIELISDKLVRDFSTVIGDVNSFHISDESAAITVFKKRIVHGVHLLAYVSVLIGQKLPGFGTIYCSHEFEFFSPVYIDQTILVKVAVIEKLSHHRIKLKTEIINQTTEKLVFSGIAVVKTYQ